MKIKKNTTNAKRDILRVNAALKKYCNFYNGVNKSIFVPSVKRQGRVELAKTPEKWEQEKLQYMIGKKIKTDGKERAMDATLKFREEFKIKNIYELEE